MEIRHTIEILTKDIQDIEKLVGNLQNSQDGYAIELDLALSKLRNVYEILMMIKADRLHEILSLDKLSEPPPVPQPQQAPQTISQPDPEPIPPPDPKPDPQTASPSPQPAVEKKTVPADPEDKKEAEIVAEKFSAESSINENLAGQRGRETDTKLIGQPIDNIGRNIGINDRFLMIRELFDGDADSFSNLVSSLEGSGNYQEAFGLLEKQFTGSMEHEGVEILSGLLKRRFSQD
ncbi:MAG: hypothetical protein ABFS38_00115 [Bacteroidota bacterium]